MAQATQATWLRFLAGVRSAFAMKDAKAAAHSLLEAQQRGCDGQRLQLLVERALLEQDGILSEWGRRSHRQELEGDIKAFLDNAWSTVRSLHTLGRAHPYFSRLLPARRVCSLLDKLFEVTLEVHILELAMKLVAYEKLGPRKGRRLELSDRFYLDALIATLSQSFPRTKDKKVRREMCRWIGRLLTALGICETAPRQLVSALRDRVREQVLALRQAEDRCANIVAHSYVGPEALLKYIRESYAEEKPSSSSLEYASVLGQLGELRAGRNPTVPSIETVFHEAVRVVRAAEARAQRELKSDGHPASDVDVHCEKAIRRLHGFTWSAVSSRLYALDKRL